MKNISAVVFLISGVIHSIDADRTLPEILTQVCARSNLNQNQGIQGIFTAEMAFNHNSNIYDLFQIIANKDQNIRDAIVQELMMDTDDHNDKANEGFQ